MNYQNKKTYSFYVNGMHCNACTMLIEQELINYPGIIHAKASLIDQRLEIICDFDNKSEQEIANMLSVPIKTHGYSLSINKIYKDKKLSELKIAIPIAIVFVLVFVLFQKICLVNIVNVNNITFGTSFVIGIIASLSTCMAVVGGLLLSLSATFAKGGSRFKSQTMFHAGRLASFFVFGGVIGVLGSAFTLNSMMTFVLSVIIGMVMLILGINLLDIFHWTKKVEPHMPRFVSRYTHGLSKMNSSFTPLIVGIATFFLPCGFTQSMQLYTLSSGGFLSGAMTMFTFALGTFPVLLAISYGSFRIKDSIKSGIFFKSAGLIVILFSIFNIINSLVVIGLIEPIFNF